MSALPDEPPFDPYEDTTPHTTAPKHDAAAERAVLGALLINPAIADDLAKHLHPRDFYRPQHETTYAAALALTNSGKHLDPVTLAAHLTETGEIGKVGGPLTIHELLNACPNPAAWESYATTVRNHSRIRAVITQLDQGRHIATTGTLEDIERILGDLLQVTETAALRFGADTTANNAGLQDLAWLLTGNPPVIEPPQHLHRTDGQALFYKGAVNGLYGDPESGKSWIAQAAIVEALNSGGTAAMIDVDHNGPNHTAARLLLLGARLEHLANPEIFRYYEPEDGDELKAAVQEITKWAPTVVLLDSLGEAIPMIPGGNSNNPDELTPVLRLLLTPIAQAGSCLITIDHLPKSKDARDNGFAIGSVAKKRMIRGSYMKCDVRTQPAPGQKGRITLRVEKDTGGKLRENSPGGYVGTFTLDSTQPHITNWSISRDDSPITEDGIFRPTHLMEVISRYIEQNDMCTFNDIKTATKGSVKHQQVAVERLVTEGFVARLHGPRNSHRHHTIALYREAEDDNT